MLELLEYSEQPYSCRTVGLLPSDARNAHFNIHMTFAICACFALIRPLLSLRFYLVFVPDFLHPCIVVLAVILHDINYKPKQLFYEFDKKQKYNT